MKTLRPAALLALVAAVALGACAKKEPPPPPPTPVPTVAPTPVPFKVTAVTLGRSIGEDKKIKEATTTFGPRDTIYASIASEGAAAKVTLKARWTYGAKGQLVNEETRDIAPTGPAVTEFHVAKPSGWPIGNYQLEVSADGKVAASKLFEVQK